MKDEIKEHQHLNYLGFTTYALEEPETYLKVILVAGYKNQIIKKNTYVITGDEYANDVIRHTKEFNDKNDDKLKIKVIICTCPASYIECAQKYGLQPVVTGVV